MRSSITWYRRGFPFGDLDMPRKQRDPERELAWRRHLAHQRTSGLTVRAFCSLHNLQKTSFFYWKKEIARRDREALSASAAATSITPPTPAFVPVSITDSPVHRNETPIDIRLADGQRVRVRSGCDRALLADVLAMLRPSSSASMEDHAC
jgi:hypothetical protein